MKDSRLEERIKNFQSNNSKITRQREDFSLNLRKEKLFNYIMEKRLNKTYDQINRDMEINLENLNISGKIKELFQIISNEEKLDYIIKWILEDDTQNLDTISDLKKYAIHNLKIISDDLNLDNSSEDIKLDNNLIHVLLYDLYESKEISVKLDISQIFLNLSYNSKNISEILIDIDYLNKFLELTYSNCFALVENILIIIGNIIQDNPPQIEFIVTKIPIIYRLKELIQYDKFEGNGNMRNYLLWLIKCFASKMPAEKFIMFVDFIPYLIKYFQLNYIQNEEILHCLLNIFSTLSFDDKFLADKLISNNILIYILEILNRKNLVRENIVFCVRILGNLMYRSNSVVDYLLERKILQTFEKLINTYRNSANSQDNIILNEVIWAISNITAGTTNQVEAVIFSNLPKIIMNLNKLKKNNKILLESNTMFYAALYNGNSVAFLEMMKIDVIRLFADAVNNSENVDLIDSGLSALIKVIEWSQNEYNSYNHIKNELNCYNSMNRIERLSSHKNEKISKQASKILEMLDMINNSDKMDYEGI